MKKILTYLKNTDKILLFSSVGLSLFSVFLLFCMKKTGFVYSIKIPLVQFAALILGVAAAVIISGMNYRDFIGLYKIYMPVGIGLMLLTFTPLAYKRAEANDRAWINLGITTFQPSEFLKIVFILSFAYHLAKVGNDINKPSNILKLLVHFGICAGLVFLQNDFGTGTVFVFIFLAMMFCSGISVKYILGALGAAVPLGLIAWFFILDDYHRMRVAAVFNPDLDPLGIGYQQLQGKISIGSGGLLGKGLFSENLRNIPEVYNDFMFAFIGEALGFIGTAVVLAFLITVAVRILFVARAADDREGYYICIGFFAMFTYQILINVGMCLGVAPVIGITLPLLSQGGSSLLMMFLGIGIVLSVYNGNRKTIFH